VLYCAFEIILPELTNYSFQDLGNIGMVGGANPHPIDEELMEVILKKAQEHRIALAPEQITVQRIGTPGAPAVCASQCSGKFAGIFLCTAFHCFQRKPWDSGHWRTRMNCGSLFVCRSGVQ
jgi:hypothetical protein